MKRANSWILSLACVLGTCGCGSSFTRDDTGSSGQAGQESAGSAGRESTGDAGKNTGTGGKSGVGGKSHAGEAGRAGGGEAGREPSAKGGRDSGGEAGQDGGGTAGTAHTGTGGRTGVGGTTSRGGSSASSGGASEAGRGGESSAGRAGDTESEGGTNSFGGKHSTTAEGGRSSGGTTGTAEGGTTEVAAGGTGQGGEVAAGGSGAQPPELTGPCETMGAFACNAGNKKLPLYCNSDHVWAAQDICDSKHNCDSTDGTCKEIVQECADKAPNESFCSTYGDVLYTCGPDLVTISERTCDGLCIDGTCREPRCGDGKLQAGEECDDGNLITTDVCQPDCRLTTVVQLVAGSAHTCALLSGGDVRCWGWGSDGRLGQGNSDSIGDDEEVNSIPPVNVGGKVVSLAAGTNHTCVLLEGGSVRCWGYNPYGQLGYGNTESIGDNEVPIDAGDVDVGGRVISIGAGGSRTCALLVGNDVRCWGEGAYGALGYGNDDNVGDNEVPSSVGYVPLGYSPTGIGSGSRHSCAIVQDGNLLCWGSGSNGTLGYGDQQNIGDDELPSTVVSPIVFASKKVVEASAGSSHTCALFDDGTIRCWGSNSNGQVGTADLSTVYMSASDAPDLSPLGADTIHVTSGDSHNCVITSEGNLRCWGLNSRRQLGTDFTTSAISAADATNVVLDGKATAMALGTQHTCVVVDHTRVRCWGTCRRERDQWDLIGVPGACAAGEYVVGGEAIISIDPVKLFDD